MKLATNNVHTQVCSSACAQHVNKIRPTLKTWLHSASSGKKKFHRVLLNEVKNIMLSPNLTSLNNELCSIDMVHTMQSWILKDPFVVKLYCHSIWFNMFKLQDQTVQLYQTAWCFICMVMTKNIPFFLFRLSVLGGGSEDSCSDTLRPAGVVLAAGGARGTAAERIAEEEHC